MSTAESRARRRRWADIVVIAVGVYEFGMALWSPGLGQPDAVVLNVPRMLWYWAATAGGGTLAIAAVLIALRNTALARVLTLLAGVLLLTGLIAFDQFSGSALVHLVLPALALFAATPFLGPMPSPEEEGHAR